MNKRTPGIKIEYSGFLTSEEKRKRLVEELEKLDKQGNELPPVSFPIAFKLVIFIVVLLLISLSTITIMVSYLVSADVRVTAEDNNYNINQRAASEAKREFNKIIASCSGFLDDILFMNKNSNDQNKQRAETFFFEHNPNICAIAIIEGEKTPVVYYSKSSSLEISSTEVNDFFTANFETASRAALGEIFFRNAGPWTGQRIITLFLPWSDSGNAAVAIFFDTSEITNIISGSLNSSFILNEEGKILLHKNFNSAIEAVDMSSTSFVSDVLNGNGQNIQTMYTDEKGVQYFGAFERLIVDGSHAGITAVSSINANVITIIPSHVVFDGTTATTRRNIFFSAAVLVVCIFFVLVFSGTLSKPLRSLTKAAWLIENGEYDFQLSCHSRDEIGVLTNSFKSMQNGLFNFEKFTNKAVVALARRGKLHLTGTQRYVAICFTLIRDYSKIAAGMSAEETVNFINTYLSRIVPCVTATGGTIDKFLTQGGVVIMALWGAVGPVMEVDDAAAACIRSAIMMRCSLLDLNRQRRLKDPNAPVIKMGCGINSGSVVAGQMGSEERMEYTVIGDAVNLAARIEGPNEAFDTDILVTENFASILGKTILQSEMPSLDIKGKEKPMRVFAVVNIKDTNEIQKTFSALKKTSVQEWISRQCVGRGGPETIDEVRELWQ